MKVVAPECTSLGIPVSAELLYAPFEAWLDTRLSELSALSATMTDAERETHGAHLRAHLRAFTKESAFLERTNARPRGYAGGAEMMRMLYDPDFRGQSMFGRPLHRHPLESAAAQAVRY